MAAKKGRDLDVVKKTPLTAGEKAASDIIKRKGEEKKRWHR